MAELVQNSGPQTPEEAQAQIERVFGDAVLTIGTLEFRVETGNDEVPADYVGCLPWQLVLKACAPLLEQYAEDVQSSESMTALRNGKRLTYYLYAPKEVAMKVLTSNIQQEEIENVPVQHLPLGVHEQRVRLSPPVVLSQ
jgi:hypothetical protein